MSRTKPNQRLRPDLMQITVRHSGADLEAELLELLKVAGFLDMEDKLAGDAEELKTGPITGVQGDV